MKSLLVLMILVFILSSQIHCTMVSDGQYMIAHSDNHRDAYITWRQAREKGIICNGMILVHFDAHHDMDCLVGEYYEQWLSSYTLPPQEVRGTTNATFIDAAVNEGLIREIWWVMPDYMYWGDHFDSLDTFTKQGEPALFYKYVRFCDCQKEGHVMCYLMDIHDVAPPLPTLDKYTKTDALVHFVTIDMLPHFEEEVLLDIDTDYFINGSDVLLYPEYFYEEGNLNPWISVDEFMAGVINTQMRSRVVTVALSSHYTHEEYHYLSWVLVECITEYLSGVYSNEKWESFSVV